MTFFFCTHHLDTRDICSFTNKIYYCKRMAPNNKWNILIPLKFFYTVTIRWFHLFTCLWYACQGRHVSREARVKEGTCQGIHVSRKARVREGTCHGKQASLRVQFTYQCPIDARRVGDLFCPCSPGWWRSMPCHNRKLRSSLLGSQNIRTRKFKTIIPIAFTYESNLKHE